MKKILSLFLISSLLMSACGSNNDKGPQGPSQEPGDQLELDLDTQPNLPQNTQLD